MGPREGLGVGGTQIEELKKLTFDIPQTSVKQWASRDCFQSPMVLKSGPSKYCQKRGVIH